MIQPHLATMLAFITTDAVIDKISLQKALQKAVDNSFNSYIDVGRFSFDGSAAVGSSVWKRNGLAGYIEDSLNITFWGESDLSCPVQVHGPTVGSFPWANIADVYTP